MTWTTTPSSAAIFVVWDPYISGPMSCKWDGQHTVWDDGDTDWDAGATLWEDRLTTWVE
jgi:hypothetical protein